jgi:ATP-dependent RNA helicase DDX55/SPB4
MPELKGVETSRWREADIEVRYIMLEDSVMSIVPMQWDNYSYADKAQEAKRLKSAAEAQQAADCKRSPSDNKQDKISWSKQLAKKDVKEKRRAQRTRKKAWIASTRPEKERKEQSTLKRMRAEGEEKLVDSADAEDDWTSFAEEERLAKKLKKGKITQDEFDATTHIDI